MKILLVAALLGTAILAAKLAYEKRTARLNRERLKKMANVWYDHELCHGEFD